MTKDNEHISYDFQEGQIVELFYDRPQEAWHIYCLPDDVLRKVISWNDKDGDFDDLDRVRMLEILIVDFIAPRKGN